MLAPQQVRRATNSLANLIGRGWRSVHEHAVELLFVGQCLSCSRELPENHTGVSLCLDCLAQIPPVNWALCRRCAAEVPGPPGDVETCPRCRTDKLRFDATLSLGHYAGGLREMILRMKHDQREQWGQLFAQLVEDRLGSLLHESQLDAIVPVPATAWNRWLRGTNAPTVIARALSQKLGVPAYTQLVRRSYGTVPQRGLSRSGRFRNVRGGYHVRKGYQLASPHLLLVDDVMTTGATCSEIARLLKRSGAVRVTVLVIARTPNS